VFALAGVRPDDEWLVRGIDYLQQKIALHPSHAGSHAEARGAKPRYLTYGLMGLTAYGMPVEEVAHSAAIAKCVEWLARHGLDEGADVDTEGQGWAEHPHLQRVSILSTSIAARALDRVPAGTPDADNARELVSHARRRLRRLARGDARRRWWPTRADIGETVGDDCAGSAVTALAVLALAEGGPTSQAYARAGVRWLLDSVERWQQGREPEENVPDANWIHVSCAICLSAVLVQCAGIDSETHSLAVPISYLDRLWHDDAGEWRHGHPAADISTSADLHAAAAIRAMRRSWRGFDPVHHLLGGRRRQTTLAPIGDKPSQIRWLNQTLTILGGDETVLARRSFPARATAMNALLDASAGRWNEAGAGASLVERSLTASELTDITSISDIYEYVRRLNDHVRHASLEQRGRPCVIVARIESGISSGEDRYALLGSRLSLA
jgi:hypothetical protein